MIPDYQSIMLPLLKLNGDNATHRFRDVVDILGAQFQLSDRELKELLPSGTQAIFENRVGWARFYLTKAGLLKSERRGTHQITEQGLSFLKSNPKELRTKDLDNFKAFVDFKNSVEKKATTEQKESDIITEETPEEALEYAYLKLKNDLSRDLLSTIKSCSPSFFERLVIDLITKMGYGGSRKDAGQALGRSGDGGIDGIIKEDKLGLDTIYIQAKKWDNTVPIKEIRDFAGALLSKKSRKGIFITTSNFPKSAYEYVESIEHRIILIDGERLTNLMFEYNIGVGVQSVYEVKRIDTDYFED